MKMNEVSNKLWERHNTKRSIITQILQMAKENQLHIEQKKMLFKMINDSDRTEKQKSRFIKFYNLDITKEQNYTLTTLAKECGCKSAAIRFSLSSVITYTLLNNDENMYILKRMTEA